MEQGVSEASLVQIFSYSFQSMISAGRFVGPGLELMLCTVCIDGLVGHKSELW